MEEWKTYELSDIADIVTGKTPSTKDGSNFGGSIHFITPGDINKGLKHVYSTERTLTESGLRSIKGSIVYPNSICVSCIGNIGYVGMPTMKCATNQQINTLIVKDGFDTDFVYYLMRFLWPAFKSFEGQSTTLSILNKSLFSKIQVRIPSLTIQKKIAGILSSIDDKIELNTRINHNLEKQAQALYKSWFVDFEPFKDRKFVESELGMIPEGWRVGTLSELGDIVAGGTPSKAKPEYYSNNGIAWLTPKDLSVKCNKFTAKGELDITEDGYKNSSAKLMPRGTVLFSSRAPIGYISIAKGDICTNQGFKSIVPKYAGTAYLYYWLQENTNAIEAQASGSTFKEASGSLMKSFPALIPCKDVLDAFEDDIMPILKEQENLEEENGHTEQLRDILLPHLMSGEWLFNDLTR